MSKILVSGGAGFLGSNLCERLIDNGESVWCLDNLSTGGTRNIEALYPSNRFHFVNGNATEPPDVAVDQIYSLASPTAPGAYQAMPEATRRANVDGTEALLKMARRQGATMLYTSSIRVTEPLEDGSKHACYVESKAQGEELCVAHHAAYGTRVKVARLFNTYGPKMALNDSRVVPQFIMRALKGEPLKIAGDGMQRDSFCYVTDMLDALIGYMNSDIFPGPMEFGYPVPIEILSLAKLAIAVTGSKSAIVHNGVERSSQEMEIKRRRPVPDIREAQKRLDWTPRVPLEYGLARLADYYAWELSQ